MCKMSRPEEKKITRQDVPHQKMHKMSSPEGLGWGYDLIGLEFGSGYVMVRYDYEYLKSKVENLTQCQNKRREIHAV